MVGLSRLLVSFWLAAATHLWQTTLVLLFLLALARLLRDAPARFLLAVYWAGFLKLFVPLSVTGRLVAKALAVLGSVERPATGSSSMVTVMFAVLDPAARIR